MGRTPMNRAWQEDGYLACLKMINAKLTGIERLAGFVLFAPWVLLLSFWIQKGMHRWRPTWRTQVIEAYVVACTVLTILNWCLGPTFWGNIGRSYISASTIITLLQVVFLHTLFGEMHSSKRSMITSECECPGHCVGLRGHRGRARGVLSVPVIC
jgi:hypothetical protein